MLKKSFIGLLLPFSLFSVMGSVNYKIQADSVNFGGGNSNSASYTMEDTLGEVATGVSDSTNYRLSAGYQQMLQSYISITTESDIALASLSGLTGGVSNASTTWTVLTDNPAGYSLSIRASTNPALIGPAGAHFDDYAPVSNPDFTFSIPSSQSAFGFSPEGVDVNQKYLDNGSACNTGSMQTTDKCWDGFSTSNKIIAGSIVANHPLGTPTTVKFRSEIGTSKIQDSGVYSATITVTAVAL